MLLRCVRNPASLLLSSDSPSVCMELENLCRYFHETYFRILRKIVAPLQFLFKSDKCDGHFTLKAACISACISLNTYQRENVSNEMRREKRKKKIKLYFPDTFNRKFYKFRDNYNRRYEYIFEVAYSAIDHGLQNTIAVTKKKSLFPSKSDLVLLTSCSITIKL